MAHSFKTNFLRIGGFVIIVIFFLVVFTMVRNCRGSSSLDSEGFSGGDTLDIALIYGPGSYYMSSDSLSGINSSIAYAFSDSTNIPVRIWPITDPASGFEKLESGAFDIIASLPLDNDIKERFKTSESVFLDRLVLVELADSLTGKTSVESSLQLIDKEVHIPAGSSALQRLENLSEEIGGNIEIVEEPQLSDELLTLKVAAGDFPLAIVNEKVAENIGRHYPNLKYNKSIGFTQFQVWVFPKNDSVNFNRFNSWLKSFKQTESYKEIISNNEDL